VVSGDGRYMNDTAIQTIIKIAAANKVERVVIGVDGLMSTPCVSGFVRNFNKDDVSCMGAIVLTASHNPGGPDADFGIKFNCTNGGPAPESITNEVYTQSCEIKSFKIVNDIPDVDLSSP
jgi:phosphoglucomutase